MSKKVVKNRFKNGDYYEGEILNKKLHGTGKYIWASGDVYIGEWFENKRHGVGKIIFKNGESYEGQWANNRKHGEGVYIYADGTREDVVYENDVKQEILELESVDLSEDALEEVMLSQGEDYDYDDEDEETEEDDSITIEYVGDKYYFGEGYEMNGIYYRHGKGDFIYREKSDNQWYCEEGYFDYDKLRDGELIKSRVYWAEDYQGYVKEPFEILVCKNGDIISTRKYTPKKLKLVKKTLTDEYGTYVGETYDDIFNGYGVLKSKNGWVYEGEFKDGYFHGYGKYTYDDGEVHEGDFKAGLFQGRGTYYYKDGSIFVGHYERDKIINKGFYYEIQEDGSYLSYKCNYRNGLRHGKCVVYKCNNFRLGKKNYWEELRIEFYKNGEFIEETYDMANYRNVRDYNHYLICKQWVENYDFYEVPNLVKYFYGSLTTKKTPPFHKEVWYERLNWEKIYKEFKEAFDEGKYYKIIECLVFGFQNPQNEFYEYDKALRYFERFSTKGFLENKFNYTNIDDYLTKLLKFFYETCLSYDLEDAELLYADVVPYIAAGFALYTKDSRYLWDVRKFYRQHTDGYKSFIIFLYELREIDSLADTVKYVFRGYDFNWTQHDEAYEAYCNNQYYSGGCWIKK